MATRHVVSSGNSPIELIGGTIRNTGGVWELINDAGHVPLNIDSVTTTADSIIINHANMGATQVGSLVAVPDETLAQNGIFAGVSVGLTQSVIKLAQSGITYSDYVQYESGIGWTTRDGVFTNITHVDGALQLNHPPIIDAGVFNCSVVSRAGATGTYHANLSNVGSALAAEYIKIEFRDAVTGELKLQGEPNFRAAVSHGGGTRKIDPRTIDQVKYPNSNIWISGFMKTA